MAEQRGCGDGASEGDEVRNHVIARGYKSPVQDVGHCDEQTACESHRQEEAHHCRQSSRAAMSVRDQIRFDTPAAIAGVRLMPGLPSCLIVSDWCGRAKL